MIVGIDPGINGAAAALWRERGFITVIDLPTGLDSKLRRQIAPDELLAWLRAMAPERIVMENVHSLPREGVTSAFRFGVAVGMIKAMSLLVVPDLELVEPAVWKEYFQLPGGDKEASRKMALRLFPDLNEFLTRKKDHQRAEAALIARWALRPPIGRDW
jgi:crossover junction endodeoxyribonuclease RuvC